MISSFRTGLHLAAAGFLFACSADESAPAASAPAADPTHDDVSLVTPAADAGPTSPVDGGEGDGDGGVVAPPFDPEAGWTNFPEQPETVRIYVSSSTGDDAADGTSEAAAVRTIARGKALVRGGRPDRLLLKRGDVWAESLGTWDKSGKGPDAPLVVASYGTGTERPLLKTGVHVALYASSTSTVDYVAFQGLHLYAHTRDPHSEDYAGAEGDEGISWNASSHGLWFEDLYVQFYKNANMTVEGTGSTDVTIRRNVIADSYANPADDVETHHSEGLYTNNVSGLLLEENVFDHNGWNDDRMPVAEKTKYNHDVYVMHTCTGVIVRGNAFLRASATGIQVRPGGIVRDNLFFDNPIGMTFGLVLGLSEGSVQHGVTGEVVGNVILSGGDLGNGDNLYRGIGINFGNITGATVQGNIIAHDASLRAYGAAFNFTSNGVDFHDMSISQNVLYDWRGNVQWDGATYQGVRFFDNEVQSPADDTPVMTFLGGISSGISFERNTWDSHSSRAQWLRHGGEPMSYDEWVARHEPLATAAAVPYVDPARSPSTYQASLGAEASVAAFLAEIRKQQRGNYRQAYTTAAILAYVRAGFAHAP